MKSEQSLIEMFSRVHGTRPFVADAEIVPFGGTNLLVSTDSFSEREDFLSGLEPEAMGRVMAYGAIADILSCGAKPVFPVNYDNCHLMNARNEALCQRAKGEEEQPSPSILLHGGTGAKPPVVVRERKPANPPWRFPNFSGMKTDAPL